jgi:outer membrane protein OmpA-like peptidoglycan-associated protein
MKITKSIFGCGMALALSAGVANAQDDSAEKSQLPVWMENVYLGGSIGATTTITDVKQYDLYPVRKYRNEIGFGGEGFIGYTINSAFSVEGRLAGIGINGTNRANNEWFTGGGFEPSLNLKVNFTNLFFTGAKKGSGKLAVSGYAGAGLFMFRSRLYLLNEGTKISEGVKSDIGANVGFENDYETKNNRTQEISIPIGIQVAYKITNQIEVLFDQRIGLVQTDKLDAKVSGTSSGEFYTYTALGLNYKLSDKQWLRPEDQFNDKLAVVDSILEGFIDTDNDGVMDNYDKDNKTPEGAKTTGDGMAMDTDGDGVADYVDQERLSICTEVDENGVALDTDGDNVPNCKDSEPNTESGAQVDVTGKAISALAGLSTSDNASADAGLPSVYFAMSSTKLGYENYTALTEVAKFLKKNKGVKLTVVGHTDATGSEDFNKKLGTKRAQAVIDHLVKIYGIDASNLTASSEGSSNGIALAKAAKANRRVDFLFTK